MKKRMFTRVAGRRFAVDFTTDPRLREYAGCVALESIPRVIWVRYDDDPIATVKNYEKMRRFARQFGRRRSAKGT